MSSSKEVDAKFSKIVDQFTLELSDNDKERLVAAYNLNDSYFKESQIRVMTMLKMIGKFSSKNPEGLLDIADFLDRTDLLEKYSPKIQGLKSCKLRKSSSAVFLTKTSTYSNDEVKSALNIAVGQVELGHASSGLLKKMCTQSKPNDRKRLSEHLEDVEQDLEGVVAKLHEIGQLMDSDPPQIHQHPAPESESTALILKDEIVVQPRQETYKGPPSYENVGHQSLEGSRKPEPTLHKVLPVGKNSWVTPPGTRRSEKPPPPDVPAKPSTPGNERRQGKVPLMPPSTAPKARKNPVQVELPSHTPPPVRPKPTLAKRPLQPQITTEDEVQYDLPHSPAPGNRFSGTFSTGSDSGITGDWPEPRTKPKGDNFYQPLLHDVSERDEMIYEEPM